MSDAMIDTLNPDCLIHIFRHLSMRDKLQCRLVCRRWQTAVDKMFSGQRSLEIIAWSKKTGPPVGSPTAILVDRRKLNFRVFNFMLMRFRNIQTLTIRNLMQLSDIVMFTITKNCDNLSHLHLCSCNGLHFDENNEHSLFNSLTGLSITLICCHDLCPPLSSILLLTDPITAFIL